MPRTWVAISANWLVRCYPHCAARSVRSERDSGSRTLLPVKGVVAMVAALSGLSREVTPGEEFVILRTYLCCKPD